MNTARRRRRMGTAAALRLSVIHDNKEKKCLAPEVDVGVKWSTPSTLRWRSSTMWHRTETETSFERLSRALRSNRSRKATTRTTAKTKTKTKTKRSTTTKKSQP